MHGTRSARFVPLALFALHASCGATGSTRATAPTTASVPARTASDYATALATFRAATTAHVGADGSPAQMDEPSTRALCEPLSHAAARHLADHGVRVQIHNTENTCALELAPGDDSPLNALARDAAQQAGARVVYDLRYFARNPFASASYDRDAAVLFLSHDAVLEATPHDLAVEHEWVHLLTGAARRARKPLPYYGWLSGEPFRPQSLFLDEMLAYAQDADRIVERMLRALSDPHAAIEPLVAADLGALLRTRLTGERPTTTPGDPIVRLWDRLAARVFFGENHTAPAVHFLPRLAAAAARDPSSVRFDTAPWGGTLARVSAPASEGDPAIEGTFELVTSEGPRDTRNVALVRAQIEWVRRAADTHAARLRTLRDALTTLATTPPAQRREVLTRALSTLPRTPDVPPP